MFCHPCNLLFFSSNCWLLISTASSTNLICSHGPQCLPSHLVLPSLMPTASSPILCCRHRFLSHAIKDLFCLLSHSVLPNLIFAASLPYPSPLVYSCYFASHPILILTGLLISHTFIIGPPFQLCSSPIITDLCCPLYRDVRHSLTTLSLLSSDPCSCLFCPDLPSLISCHHLPAPASLLFCHHSSLLSPLQTCCTITNICRFLSLSHHCCLFFYPVVCQFNIFCTY